MTIDIDTLPLYRKIIKYNNLNGSVQIIDSYQQLRFKKSELEEKKNIFVRHYVYH